MESHYSWHVVSYQSAPHPNIDLPGHRYLPDRSLFFPWVGAASRRGGALGDTVGSRRRKRTRKRGDSVIIQRVSNAGLYIHVPFCSSVCPYCDFAVTIAGEDRRAAYLDALDREIILSADLDLRFDTVYFGGGTPSSLSPGQLGRILATIEKSLNLTPDAIRHLEINPDDVGPAKAAAWRELGFSFASLGVQSFSDEVLGFLGRGHRAADARRAAETLLDAGFATVSVDLIFGLPGQTAEDWRRQLESRPFARRPPPFVLPTHHPRRHRLRPPARPRRASGTRRGRPGRALSADPRDPRRRRLAGLRGLQFRRRCRPPVETQPEVLGPHPVPRARSVVPQLRRSPAVVESAQGEAVDRRHRGRPLPDRGTGRPQRRRTLLRSGDAGSENRRRRRPRRAAETLRRRSCPVRRARHRTSRRLRPPASSTVPESNPRPKVWRSPRVSCAPS